MTAVRDRFILREGFDADGSLLPGTDPDDARMLWVGYTVEGFTVVLTAEPGVTAGTFIGPLGHYTLLRGTMDAGFAHEHLLRDVSAEIWDPDDPDAFWAMPSATLAGYGMLASTGATAMPSNGFGYMSSPAFLQKNLVPEENTIRVDVAVVWTDAAEAAANDTGDGGAMDIGYDHDGNEVTPPLPIGIFGLPARGGFRPSLLTDASAAIALPQSPGTLRGR